ncbi:MAG: histidine phosphatase family protein [Nitrososphaerota archaeon]|nr:histidine phosphatase family protein [Nitrososphaerota archaeon]
MDVYIVRHARSTFGRKGEDPPVSEEGEKELARMLDLAKESFGFKPTLIVTSPILRARQTAETVKKRTGGSVKTVVEKCLLPDTKPEEVAAFLETLKMEERVVLVSHMPVVFELLYYLIGGRGEVELLNGSIAAVHFDKRVASGGGKLVWLLQPVE